MYILSFAEVPQPGPPSPPPPVVPTAETADVVLSPEETLIRATMDEPPQDVPPESKVGTSFYFFTHRSLFFYYP